MDNGLLDTPLDVNLNGIPLKLDILRPDQYSAAYDLVSHEAEKGNDVGTDEFPTPTCLFSLLAEARNYSLSDPSSHAIRAFISISPSSYCRGTESNLASGLFICNVTLKKVIAVDAISLAIRLTEALQYQGILADVFHTSPFVNILRSKGFTVVARIPNSGFVTRRGWTDSLILFKNIKMHKQMLNPRPLLIPVSGRSENQKNIGNAVVEATKQSENLPVYMIHMVQKPSLKYLPRMYTFKSGIKANIRYAIEEDIPILFTMYKSAAQEGHGFTVDEFDSLDIFRYLVIDHGHPIVAVNTTDNQIIMSFTVLPSLFCRSADPLLSDVYIVVHQGLRGKGIGLEGSTLALKLVKELGYSGIITDVLYHNKVVMGMLKYLGFAVIGQIPDAVKEEKDKCGDLLIVLKDLADIPEQFAHKL